MLLTAYYTYKNGNTEKVDTFDTAKKYGVSYLNHVKFMGHQMIEFNLISKFEIFDKNNNLIYQILKK